MERQVAKKLGGVRHVRTSYYESAPDVDHPQFSIECKYRKKLPAWLKDAVKQAEGYAPEKLPIVVLKERNQRSEFVLMTMEGLLELLEGWVEKNGY